MIAAAQCGAHEDGRETFGHSLAIDPWGEVLADLQDNVGLRLVDLDAARVAEVRQRIPVISHRRPIAPVVIAP